MLGATGIEPVIPLWLSRSQKDDIQRRQRANSRNLDTGSDHNIGANNNRHNSGDNPHSPGNRKDIHSRNIHSRNTRDKRRLDQRREKCGPSFGSGALCYCQFDGWRRPDRSAVGIGSRGSAHSPPRRQLPDRCPPARGRRCDMTRRANRERESREHRGGKIAHWNPPLGEMGVLAPDFRPFGPGFQVCCRKNGGRDRDRTCDPYHVKVVLFR